MTDIISPVVVGVDGSPIAIRAALWAAGIARRLGAPLHIVHAQPYLGHNFSDGVAEARASELAAQHELAQAILKAAEDAVRADFHDQRITTDDLSDSVDVATLLGSTTVSVAAHATCPVVASRGASATPTDQPILLGVDGDDDSRVAITAAFELANRLGVGIIAVHAWSKRRSPGDVTLSLMIDWDAVEADQRRHLSDLLQPWIGLYPGVDVKFVVDPNKPSKALLAYAEGCQLTVVGSRGRGLISGAVLGSTGLNLLHHSAIPVMICRSAIQEPEIVPQTHHQRTGTTP